MKYVKPDFIVEEFMLNTAVATCTETWDDVKVPEQTIYCYRSNRNETLFNLASACGTYPADYAYVQEGTYSQSDLKAYLPNLNVDGGNGGSITVPAGGGVVLIWKGQGQGYCYGLATAKITTIINTSY